MIDYKEYQHLLFERRPNGVLLITLNRPEVLNATNDRLHWELTQIWLTIDRDKDTRVAVVTGAGRAFSAGGDMDMVERNATDPRRLANTVREASDIVYNMINLDKPVISAINRSEEHTSELQSQSNLVCRLLLEKKKAPHARRLSTRRAPSR